MPAEIKAKLELITGGTPASAGGTPAIGGGGGSNSRKGNEDSNNLKIMGDSLKTFARFLNKPGVGTGVDLISSVTGMLGNPLVLAAMGVAAAGIFASIATKGAFDELNKGKEIAAEADKVIEDFRKTQSDLDALYEKYKEYIVNPNTPSPSPNGMPMNEAVKLIDYEGAGGAGGTGMDFEKFSTQYDYLERLKDYQKEINEITKDGITLEEEKRLEIMEQEVTLIKNDSLQQNMYEARSESLNLLITLNDAMIEQAKELNTTLGEPVTKNVTINYITRTKGSGSKDEVNEYEYEGKTYIGKENVGNLQDKVIMVRTVA